MMEINDGDLEKNWVKKIFYLFHHLIAAFSPFDVFSLIIVFILAGFSATFFDRYIDVFRANTDKNKWNRIGDALDDANDGYGLPMLFLF